MTATLELQPGRHRVKVGDVFERSWGYNQTNVNYYMVVELSKTGKTAKLREIGSTCVDDTHAPVTHVVPDTERFLDQDARWCGACRKPIRRYGELHPRAGELVHTSTDEAYCIDEDGYEIPGSSIPVLEPHVYTKRIQVTHWGGKPRPVLSWNSYSNAYLWDGTPQYQTGLGWGH